jgi:hypothetical protein
MEGNMKKIIEKIISTKNIIVISLVISLNIIIIKGIHIDDNLFLLLSNLLTVIVTYYFTKRKSDGE